MNPFPRRETVVKDNSFIHSSFTRRCVFHVSGARPSVVVPRASRERRMGGASTASLHNNRGRASENPMMSGVRFTAPNVTKPMPHGLIGDALHLPSWGGGTGDLTVKDVGRTKLLMMESTPGKNGPQMVH